MDVACHLIAQLVQWEVRVMVHKHAKLVIKKMKQLMLQTLPVYSVQVVSSRDTTILLATIVLLGHTRHSEYVWLVWFPTLSPMVQLRVTLHLSALLQNSVTTLQ